MRARLLSLLLCPTPLSFGLVVAALLIVAETLLLYPLRRVASAGVLGAVHLLGVLIVTIG
jgi:hypothetical protein